MTRIARQIAAHRRAVLIAWIVGALGLLVVSHVIGSTSSSSFTLPGTGSQQAVNLLQSRFPSQAGDADQIVFHASSGTLTKDRAAISATLGRVARLPHVVGVSDPFSTAAGTISRDGTIGFATVSFDESAADLPTSAVKHVISAAQSADSSRLQVQLGGQAIENAQRASPGSDTIIGIIAAIVILLIAFGSFIAMTLPLITAIVGLIAGLGAIGLASHLIGMASFASELALMIGLGVGIDYALLIVSRYRENFHTNGGDVQAAIDRAMNSAGRAVLFAGITVVIAVLGMFVLGIDLLNGLAVAAALGVVFVLLSTLTLLPALLSLLGTRVGQGGRLARRHSRGPANTSGESRFWTSWTTRIQRHPALTAAASIAVLIVLIAPVTGLHIGSSDAGTDAKTQTTHKAYDLLAQGFGPGFNAPLQIAVSLPTAHDTNATRTIVGALNATPGIASVSAARFSPAGTTAAIVAYPTTSPQSLHTARLVKHLRTVVLPPVTHATDTHAYVGGATASQVDFSHVISEKLPLFLLVVIALGGLLLFVVFRSLVIPIKAALMNVLSIGAAVGVSQAIFERGWGAGLLGVQKGPLDAFIPLLAFAIIFGLTTDYEVFLVSRIREEWEIRRDASAAITHGFASTARIVIAAAAVMVCVFGAFAISGQRALAEFGIMLGSAVLIDAVLVRMLLLPAVLQLLGRITWSLPSWLDRILPHLAIDAPPIDTARTQRPSAGTA
jgi:RND superfamily putative drug exporter